MGPKIFWFFKMAAFLILGIFGSPTFAQSPPPNFSLLHPMIGFAPNLFSVAVADVITCAFDNLFGDRSREVEFVGREGQKSVVPIDKAWRRLSLLILCCLYQAVRDYFGSLLYADDMLISHSVYVCHFYTTWHLFGGSCLFPLPSEGYHWLRRVPIKRWTTSHI